MYYFAPENVFIYNKWKNNLYTHWSTVIYNNSGFRLSLPTISSHFQEHFHKVIAVTPPKNIYIKFLTSCVISNPYPSPTTQCQEDPNFLSRLSLIIFAAALIKNVKQWSNWFKKCKTMQILKIKNYNPRKIFAYQARSIHDFF